MFWEDDFDEGLENFFDLQPVPKVQMVIVFNTFGEVLDTGGTQHHLTILNHEMKSTMRVYCRMLVLKYFFRLNVESSSPL